MNDFNIMVRILTLLQVTKFKLRPMDVFDALTL